MRKIAIIKTRDFTSFYDSETVILSITDWSEVSEEDYKLLDNWSRKHDYLILERMDTNPDFLPKTIATCKKEAEVYAEKQRKAKEEADRKKLERELKKKARTEAQEKKLLEELERKYKGTSNETYSK